MRYIVLLTTTLSGVGLWCALPSLHACRFQRAVESGDYAGAGRFFAAEAFPNNYATPQQLRTTTVTLAPLTWDQLKTGQRQLQIAVPYGVREMDCDIGASAGFWYIEVQSYST